MSRPVQEPVAVDPEERGFEPYEVTTEPFRVGPRPYVDYCLMDLTLVAAIVALILVISWATEGGPFLFPVAYGLFLGAVVILRGSVCLTQIHRARKAPWWGKTIQVRFDGGTLELRTDDGRNETFPYTSIDRGRRAGMSSILFLPESGPIAVPNRTFGSKEHYRLASRWLEHHVDFSEGDHMGAGPD